MGAPPSSTGTPAPPLLAGTTLAGAALPSTGAAQSSPGRAGSDSLRRSVVAAAPLRPLFIAGGILALMLGIAGIFLPLVPTTPFLLVAAAAFARGSPRLHAWLIQHPRLGPFLRMWWTDHAVPKRAKVLAIAVVWISMGLSIVFLVDQMWLRAMLGVVLIALTVFLARLRTYSPGAIPDAGPDAPSQ